MRYITINIGFHLKIPDDGNDHYLPNDIWFQQDRAPPRVVSLEYELVDGKRKSGVT